MDPYPVEIAFMFFNHSCPETKWNLYLCSRGMQTLLISWARARVRSLGHEKDSMSYIGLCLKLGFTEGLQESSPRKIETIKESLKTGYRTAMSPRGIRYLGAENVDPIWLLGAHGPQALRWYARELPDNRGHLHGLGIGFLVDEPGRPVHPGADLNTALRYNYRILEVAASHRERRYISTASCWNPEVPDRIYLESRDCLSLPHIILGAIRSERICLALTLWSMVELHIRLGVIKRIMHKYELAIELCKRTPDMGVEWFLRNIDLGLYGLSEGQVREDFMGPPKEIFLEIK